MKKSEIGLLIGVLALDMATKFGVQSSLALGESIPVIPGFFSITYAQNTGAAWSIMEGRTVFFCVVSVVALIGFSIFLARADKKDTLSRYATVLILAGAAGNLIDRLMFQYVRDFLDFCLFGYDFPIFNVADSALVIGVGLLILATCLHPEGRKTA